MESARRVIRLRRPPVLHREPGPFVPAVSLDEVDRAWQRLVAINPRYFDGPLLHVLGTSRNGHGGVTIHVVETSYRFYAVQQGRADCPAIDCGVRPLGVKGLCSMTRDGGRHYLMNRRSASVAFYPSMWEFAPGGVVEPTEEPSDALLRELSEETAFAAATRPTAIALIFDPQAFSWEIVYQLEVTPRPESSDDAHAWEHTHRTLAPPGAWPEPLAPIASAMLQLIAPG
jgi:8-oxo-dGTP pyrophosphatase MutT (NUDIX family)